MTTFEIFIAQIRLFRIKLAVEVSVLSELGYEDTDKVYKLGLLGSIIEGFSNKEYLTEDKFRFLVEGLIKTFRGDIIDVDNLSLTPVQYIPASCGCDDDTILATTGDCCIENFYYSNGNYVIVLENGRTFVVEAVGNNLYRIDGGKPDPSLYHPTVQGVLPD